ncbi:MAG: hypothetical protein Q7K43_00550 [Candidatus Woesearchaeota archaeon]|nr:hypothetical protein [Candidatus Woesearchaeota archaeon]
MEYRERVLSVIRLRGPTQPLVISKELNLTNSTFAGAMLSEMTDKGLLKVSHIKVGSGPLYYIPGQEEQLLRYTYALNEKDRKTVELLQQKKVLRENTQDPITRVGLKTLKDFAVPLEVQHNGTQEIFWKWFALSDIDAEQFIRRELGIKETPALAESLPVKQKQKRKEKQLTSDNQTSLENQTVSTTESSPQIFKETVAEEVVKPLNSPNILRKSTSSIAISSAQTVIAEKNTAAPVLLSELPLPVNDDFLVGLQTYFKINHIPLTHTALIKKSKEYEFIIQLPSALGQLMYYCYAVNKKKITEADLSHAFVKSQLRKLPCLFLSSGELTKPAVVYAKQLQSITFKTLPVSYQNNSANHPNNSSDSVTHYTGE